MKKWQIFIILKAVEIFAGIMVFFVLPLQIGIWLGVPGALVDVWVVGFGILVLACLCVFFGFLLPSPVLLNLRLAKEIKERFFNDANV